MKKLSHLFIAILAIVLCSFMLFTGCKKGKNKQNSDDITSGLGDMSSGMPNTSMDMSMDIGDPFDSEEPAASEEESNSSVEETPTTSEESASVEEGPTIDGWDDI